MPRIYWVAALAASLALAPALVTAQERGNSREILRRAFHQRCHRELSQLRDQPLQLHRRLSPLRRCSRRAPPPLPPAQSQLHAHDSTPLQPPPEC